MVEPTFIATFSLSIRPPDGLERRGEAGDCRVVGGIALVFILVEDTVGAVIEVDAAKERGMLVVVTEDVVSVDELIAWDWVEGRCRARCSISSLNL